MAGTAAITAGRAYVRLYTDSSEYVKGLRTAENKLRDFGSKMSSVGTQLMAFASAVAFPVGIATKTFADFQDQMLAVQAVSQSTTEEFKKLYDQAKLLGATTSFTAGQVAGGQLNLARQGFRPAEIKAAIPAVLNLARATGADLAQAADIASGTLRAFNLQASEMPRVADVLVATANNSAQTIEDLGESMKYVAPVAYQYGLSLEQTSKALGVLANMQIKGTMAGTSLRQIMLQLADPDVQKRLAEFGVTAVDAAGNMRPLGDVMVEIGKAMAKMPSGQRLALGKELFDQRAVSAGLTLATQDFDGLSDAIENAAGVAQRTSDTMDSGLGGSIRILMSAVEAVQIAIGEGLSGIMSQWGKDLTVAAQKAGEWITANQGLVMIAANLTVMLGGLGAAFYALSIPANMAATAAGMAGAAFKVMIAPAASATAAVNGLSAAMTFMAAHPVAIMVAGLAAVGAALAVTENRYQRMGSAIGNVRERADEMRAVDQGLMKELQDLGAKQSLTSDEFSRAESIISRLQGRYGDLGLSVDSLTGKIDGLAAAQERLNKRQTANAIAQLEAEAANVAAEISALEVERGGVPTQKNQLSDVLRTVMDLRHLSEGFLGTGYDAVLLEKSMAKQRERQAILQRIESLKAGDTEAITGAAGAVGTAGTPGSVVQVIPTPAGGTPGFLDSGAEARLQSYIQGMASSDNPFFTGENPFKKIADPEELKKIIPTFSTFSALDAFRAGQGGVTDPQERTAKSTEKIAKNSDVQVKETKEMRVAMQRGLRMGP